MAKSAGVVRDTFRATQKALAELRSTVDKAQVSHEVVASRPLGGVDGKIVTMWPVPKGAAFA